MNTKELLTADEVAHRLKVRPSTIRQWSRCGLIPTVRLSAKVVRYDLSALVEAMAKRQAPQEVSHAK